MTIPADKSELIQHNLRGLVSFKDIQWQKDHVYLIFQRDGLREGRSDEYLCLDVVYVADVINQTLGADGPEPLDVHIVKFGNEEWLERRGWKERNLATIPCYALDMADILTAFMPDKYPSDYIGPYRRITALVKFSTDKDAVPGWGDSWENGWLQVATKHWLGQSHYRTKAEVVTVHTE